MSDRRAFPHIRDHGSGHQELSMDYISRALKRQLNPSRYRDPSSPQHKHSEGHKHHKRKGRHKMTSFNGPWSQDLEALQEAVKSMPEQYKSSFSSASKDTLEKVCDPDVLHVWETDSDIDNLLQLTSVIAKLCNLGTRKDKGTNTNDGSMVIIAEEKSGRNNFARICQLVEYLTCADGKKHLEGTVAAFGTIIVVKGWNNSIRSDKGGRDVDATVKRLNIAIERAFKMGNSSSTSKKKLVWHHGPVIHSLLYWINNTTSTLRSSLSAITVTDSLDLSSSIKPSRPGRSNTLPDLSCLESYASKLGIPVVFLDCASQLLSYSSLATYMYYYAYYINTFLPSSLLRPHLHAAQDALVTFCFRIAGASRSRYGEDVVAQVKRHLNPSSARAWARGCIDKRSYSKADCRAAGRDSEIHRAVGLGDAPFLLFNHDLDHLPAFARLSIGPAAHGSIASYVAAPVNISFAQSRIRPSSPAPFHVLIPANGQDEEKVTNHVQGLMMAVLERVRQEKGNPTFSKEVRDMWANVSKACQSALGDAKGKMPGDVEKKVKFVHERIGEGTWGCVIGGSGSDKAARGGNGGGGNANGVSEAANANKEAVRMYGGGGNQYGNPGQQQQMGMMGAGVAMGGQQGMMPPQNSPQMAYPQPMGYAGQQGMYPPQQQQQHAQGFGNPNMQYRPGSAGRGLAQTQATGGHGGGYPQMMGGSRR